MIKSEKLRVLMIGANEMVKIVPKSWQIQGLSC